MALNIQNIFLFYPPGPQYQRGEDRSQGNIAQSTATAMRAPNDMGYVAAQLKQRSKKVKFFDYASENKNIFQLFDDIKQFKPEIIITSITTSTINDDLKLIKIIKNKFPDLIVIIKGAVFFNASKARLASFDLNDVDYIIGGEIEFSAAKIVDFIEGKLVDIKNIPAIFFKENNIWKSTLQIISDEDIANLPFPDRSVINNKLYVRPDTWQSQATIATSRGCPAACTYCLTPIISGKSVRYRSPDDVIAELEDCYFNHNIKNFFFKSDTFTINHQWVSEICNKILNSDLNGKIEWVANSRVKPLKLETLQLMKKAGCWLIAFGFETGSEETMKRIKKGATIQDNILAMDYLRRAGLKSYGFFLVGLPWEDEKHLEQTKNHIFQLNPDFIEIHIAVPYFETPLYEQMQVEGMLTKSIAGQNYFDEASSGTNYLSAHSLIRWRKKTLWQYHFRIIYIFKRLTETITSPIKLFNYFKYGLRLLKETL